MFGNEPARPSAINLDMQQFADHAEALNKIAERQAVALERLAFNLEVGLCMAMEIRAGAEAQTMEPKQRFVEFLETVEELRARTFILGGVS